jgi:uncharacterized protein YciI
LAFLGSEKRAFCQKPAYRQPLDLGSEKGWREPQSHGKKRPVKMFSGLLFAACIAGTSAFCAVGPPAVDSELRYVVFLRPDPARKAISMEERQAIQNAHMANIRKMAQDGVLVAAGPMDDTPTTISGIFVLKADSLAEAETVAGQDPTVVAGRNTVDVHSWKGPAGIGTSYFKWKKDNPEAQDVMASHAFCLIRRGPAWHGGRETYDEGEFLDTLRGAGMLAAAGPIDGDPDLLGIVIFKGASVDIARKIMAAGDAVKSGHVVVEYHVWWTADRVLPW